jgi:hypothetical protein
MSNRTGTGPFRWPDANSNLNDNLTTSTPDGGAGRDRTDDPLLAKQVLSQLSYGP